MENFFGNCDICNKQIQNGPGLYEGYPIQRYRLVVCDTCFKGNWDGWNPSVEPILIEHCKTNGIIMPERNKKGWFPRD